LDPSAQGHRSAAIVSLGLGGAACRSPGAGGFSPGNPEIDYGEADSSDLAVSFSRFALGAPPHMRNRLCTTTILRPWMIFPSSSPLRSRS